MKNYDIKTHIHLYSSWAAGRATSVSNNRFKVKSAQKILDASSLKKLIQNPDDLPKDQDSFNKTHRKWSDIRGAIPYSALGEDAQEWV